MNSSALVLLAVGVLLVTCMSFLFGFVQAGASPTAVGDGVLVGILSAMAWGLASIGADALFSNWANFFAAMFAAMSLGFLVPANDTCANSHGLVNLACQVRAHFVSRG